MIAAFLYACTTRFMLILILFLRVLLTLFSLAQVVKMLTSGTIMLNSSHEDITEGCYFLFVQTKWYYYLILGIIDVEANYIGM
jgi:hypothetical protein